VSSHLRIPFPPGSKTLPQAHQQTIANLPTHMTSQEHLGPTITTEIPANPNGNGYKARSFIDGLNGDEMESPEMAEMKIEFEKSSDQFGRITIYSIEVLG
jgi:hypothetical protein